MKLVAKIMDGLGTADGTGVMLCTEDGEPLPNQISTVLSTGAGQASELTVVFAVYGDLRLEPSGTFT